MTGVALNQLLRPGVPNVYLPVPTSHSQKLSIKADSSCKKDPSMGISRTLFHPFWVTSGETTHCHFVRLEYGSSAVSHYTVVVWPRKADIIRTHNTGLDYIQLNFRKTCIDPKLQVVYGLMTVCLLFPTFNVQPDYAALLAHRIQSCIIKSQSHCSCCISADCCIMSISCMGGHQP